MSLNVSQVKTLIVAPALEAMGMNSPAALNLVTGTGLVESDYTSLLQTNGPALGLWQMEPATHNDIWTNFVNLQPVVMRRLKTLMLPGAPLSQLTGNLLYAAAMCRIKYYRAPQPLPVATNAADLAAYWKAVYNSDLGAGVVDPVTVALFGQAVTA